MKNSVRIKLKGYASQDYQPVDESHFIEMVIKITKKQGHKTAAY